ncbi:MAG: class I SAM-dependent methyltransferase [Ignavibacteria bacterium]
MDECLPPLIRDNKFFIYPLFYYWYKNKNVDFYMNFKSLAFDLTELEFAEAYRNLDCRANDRETDLNPACVNYMLENLEPNCKTILDVGCGRGYWLNKVALSTDLLLTGCDLYDNVELKRGNYIKGNVENLPFEDNSFDIVTCHHTIEHVLNLNKAISELKRVAKKQLIIVTPCQRYFNYTLDLHLNFFPIESYLTSILKMKKFICKKKDGDWVYIGEKN